MAMPAPQYAGLTYDSLVDGMTTGFYWGLTGDRTIDWSISNGFAGEYWNNPAHLQAQIGSMLATFSYYANVRFNYIGYYARPDYAFQAGSEINVSLDGSYFFGSNSTWARGFFPSPTPLEYVGDAGDVYLNIYSQFNYLPSYELGSAGWMVFLHELGHAVGLKHPHDSGGTFRPTLQQVGLDAWDIDYMTVMSYEDTFNWNLVQWDPATPMILDVLALQYLYGKNMATNAGDSFYSLARSSFYQTYWDASGSDTLSAAAAPEGWFIMLPDMTLSTLVNTKVGLAAPLSDFSYSSPRSLVWLAGDYENAAGSSSSDMIIGSAVGNALSGNGGADILFGKGGNDLIDGGGGVDSAAFSGMRSQYAIFSSGTAIGISGLDGTDTLVNVERLEFTDRGVAFDLAGGAGLTAKLLGAVFGAPAVDNLAFVKIGIGYFDAGWSYAQVANIALDAALGAGRSNQSVFELLYFNTMGERPSAATTTFWVGQLQTGNSTQAGLVTYAAELDVNLANINLAGLSVYGLEYAL